MTAEVGNAPRDLFLIGVTGNIACGKSTVMKELARLGAETIDADAIYHALIAPGTSLTAEILRRFGAGVAASDGGIDRSALGRVVFADPQALIDLERMTHPPIRAATLERIANSSARVVAIEAVKLVEGGWRDIVDSLWVVTCLPDQEITRLMDNRGLSRSDAERRVAAQNAAEDKVAQADVVIDNSGDIASTLDQVRMAWGERRLDLPQGQFAH